MTPLTLIRKKASIHQQSLPNLFAWKKSIMQFQKYMWIIMKGPGENILMKNSSNEVNPLYGGYREAAIAQPLETPNDFQTSSPEGYHSPSERGYQPQEQLSGPQQYYEDNQQEKLHSSKPYDSYRPQYLAPPASGWLSYLGGWVTGLLFLLLGRGNGFVRFHAMQSLIFFGAMSMVTTVFNHIPFLGSLGSGLGFVTFICWIVLMVKAARGRYYKLPLIGDYAEKWANTLRD
jgi:uncharacterized membrane protein